MSLSSDMLSDCSSGGVFFNTSEHAQTVSHTSHVTSTVTNGLKAIVDYDESAGVMSMQDGQQLMKFADVMLGTASAGGVAVLRGDTFSLNSVSYTVVGSPKHDDFGFQQVRCELILPMEKTTQSYRIPR